MSRKKSSTIVVGEFTLENINLQTFILNCAKEDLRMHFVLPGAVVSGKFENLTSLTFILTLKDCIVYTGKSSISIDIINISAEKDIVAWGIGNITDNFSE